MADQSWTEHHIIITVKSNPDDFVKDKYIAGWVESALRNNSLARYNLISADEAKQKFGAVQVRVLKKVALKKPELSEVLAQLSADGSTP
jgi:hypothetical protein